MRRFRLSLFTFFAFLATVGAAPSAHSAGLPDVLLESVKGQTIDLSTSTGKLMSGVLQAFDDKVVVMFLTDNSVVTVPRDELLAVRVAAAQSAQPVQPAPSTSSASPGAPAGNFGVQAAPVAPVGPTPEQLAEIESLRLIGNEEIARGRVMNGVALALGIPALLSCIVGPVALGLGVDEGDPEAMNAGGVSLLFCGLLAPPAAALDIGGDMLRARGSAKISRANAMSRRGFAPSDFRFAAGPTQNGARLALSFRF